MEISQNSVAFSEYMNFTQIQIHAVAIIAPPVWKSVNWINKFWEEGASPKFLSDAFQTLFFCKDEIPYCLFTLTFLREIPTEPLQFPSRTKEFKTRFWLLKNSVVTVTLVMEGYFEKFCNVSSCAQCSRKFFSCEKLTKNFKA